MVDERCRGVAAMEGSLERPRVIKGTTGPYPAYVNLHALTFGVN